MTVQGGQRERGARLPVLLAISDRRLCGGRAGLAAWAAGLPRGVAIQLREKDLCQSDLVAVGRGIRSSFDGTLIVNGHPEVALAIGADGVHLPSSASWATLGPAIREQGLLLGVSTHGRAELRAASDSKADYALFGPVFDSPHKRRFGAPQGLAKLRSACLEGPPVLAVGGVEAGVAAALVAAGASGLAAIRGFASASSARSIAAAWAEAAASVASVRS